MKELPVSLSPVDEERFGKRTAKVLLQKVEDVPATLDFCGQHGVQFLIARCPTGSLEVVQEIEVQGFSLMDTLLYFSYDLKKKGVPVDSSGNLIRKAAPGEENAVKDVAREAFRNYMGHYHADRMLDREACDETYSDWAYKSCVCPGMADIVFVSEHDGRISGFGTLRKGGADYGEGLLFGVSPSCRGRNIYRSLTIQSLSWCHEEGLGSMMIATQITNLASQKIWTRIGFEPSHSFYTFHKWFGEKG